MQRGLPEFLLLEKLSFLPSCNIVAFMKTGALLPSRYYSNPTISDNPAAPLLPNDTRAIVPQPARAVLARGSVRCLSSPTKARIPGVFARSAPTRPLPPAWCRASRRPAQGFASPLRALAPVAVAAQFWSPWAGRAGFGCPPQRPRSRVSRVRGPRRIRILRS